MSKETATINKNWCQMKYRMLASVIAINSNMIGLATRFSEKYEIPKDKVKYVLAVGWFESGFQNIPSTGFDGDPSHGVYQLLFSTARAECRDIIKKRTDLYVVAKNIECGVVYLSKLFLKYTDIREAIASYNSGAPVYCKRTRTFVNKSGVTVHCVKGKLVNESYVDSVIQASTRFQTP